MQNHDRGRSWGADCAWASRDASHRGHERKQVAAGCPLSDGRVISRAEKNEPAAPLSRSDIARVAMRRTPPAGSEHVARLARSDGRCGSEANVRQVGGGLPFLVLDESRSARVGRGPREERLRLTLRTEHWPTFSNTIRSSQGILADRHPPGSTSCDAVSSSARKPSVDAL